MPGIKHICNKEEIITEMHTDIRWIRSQLEGTNGTKGLIAKTSELNAYINRLEGSISVWKFISGGGILTSIIAVILFVIDKV